MSVYLYYTLYLLSNSWQTFALALAYPLFTISIRRHELKIKLLNHPHTPKLGRIQKPLSQLREKIEEKKLIELFISLTYHNISTHSQRGDYKWTLRTILKT